MVGSVSTNRVHITYWPSPPFPVHDVVLLPGLLPIFLHGCEIKSGRGLGTRLGVCDVYLKQQQCFLVGPRFGSWKVLWLFAVNVSTKPGEEGRGGEERERRRRGEERRGEERRGEERRGEERRGEERRRRRRRGEEREGGEGEEEKREERRRQWRRGEMYAWSPVLVVAQRAVVAYPKLSSCCSRPFWVFSGSCSSCSVADCASGLLWGRGCTPIGVSTWGRREEQRKEQYIKVLKHTRAVRVSSYY